eukprot:12907892-Ditylum_brightwellii.AAC.1
MTTMTTTATTTTTKIPSPHLPGAESSQGIGIILVIIFHMGYQLFTNTWVDISCFFVLSGFLITKVTIGAYEHQGFVDICKFWAKHVSRLFSCILIAINVIVLTQKLPWRHNDGVTFQREATDLWYATIFATNYNLVYLQPDDDFDDFSALSITRHLWTLSIEEQYYIIWPLVIWLFSKLARLVLKDTSSTPKQQTRQDYEMVPICETALGGKEDDVASYVQTPDITNIIK